MKIRVTKKEHHYFGRVFDAEKYAEYSWIIISDEAKGYLLSKYDCEIISEESVEPVKVERPPLIDAKEALFLTSEKPVDHEAQSKINQKTEPEQIAELRQCLIDRLGDIAELRKQLAEAKAFSEEHHEEIKKQVHKLYAGQRASVQKAEELLSQAIGTTVDKHGRPLGLEEYAGMARDMIADLRDENDALSEHIEENNQYKADYDKLSRRHSALLFVLYEIGGKLVVNNRDGR